MPSAAAMVPAESDLLCEGCGYTLNGLPTSGNCPECGKPIDESVGAHRRPSDYEASPSPATFVTTWWAVLRRPTRFYSTLCTRCRSDDAWVFQMTNVAVASALFGLTAFGHYFWGHLPQTGQPLFSLPIAGILIIWLPVIGLLLVYLTKFAGWLSALEARYRGMRLPTDVVARGLAYHSAHYVPVGIVSLVIVWGYILLLRFGVADRGWDTTYLYTLCAAVIGSAVYLFQTYWIAMRNMRYANR